MTDHVLDHAAWSALTGAHAHLAEGDGGARRYRRDVAPFAGLAPVRDAAAWADLRTVAAGRPVILFEPAPVGQALPGGWRVLEELAGVQLVAGPDLRGTPDDEAVVLGEDDVPDMLDLAGRTSPGPFLPATRLLGTYLGIRREGRLVAMAGERVRPPGFTEISAVCTDPAARGQGLAGRLVLAVVHGIRARGDVPFLHATATNPARRLYARLGFVHRSDVVFTVLRAR
ncbi:GNAT family N-acetyltransferase [Rhodococcus aerolatus]